MEDKVTTLKVIILVNIAIAFIMEPNLVISATTSSNNKSRITKSHLRIQHRKTAVPINGNITTDSASTSIDSSSLTPPVKLSDLLPPNLLSQTDPILYLFNETMKLSFSNVQSIERDLGKFLKHNNNFITSYAPYANALSALLRCRRGLEGVKIFIRDIQEKQLKFSNDLSLPRDILTPNLSELFSSDILSDSNALSCLLIKLMNIPEKKIVQLEIELNSLLKNNSGQLSIWCCMYAKEVWLFLKNKFALSELRKSVSHLPSSSGISILDST